MYTQTDGRKESQWYCTVIPTPFPLFPPQKVSMTNIWCWNKTCNGTDRIISALLVPMEFSACLPLRLFEHQQNASLELGNELSTLTVLDIGTRFFMYCSLPLPVCWCLKRYQQKGWSFSQQHYLRERKRSITRTEPESDSCKRDQMWCEWSKKRSTTWWNERMTMRWSLAVPFFWFRMSKNANVFVIVILSMVLDVTMDSP